MELKKRLGFYSLFRDHSASQLDCTFATVELKKGLGFYEDMDKEVQDLLYKGYPRGSKLNINAPYGVGSAISYWATRLGDFFSLGCKSHIDHGKYAGNFHVDSKSRLHTDLLFDDPACGLKLWCNSIHSRPSCNKVGLQWQHNHAGVGIEMYSGEESWINFSSVIGNKVLCIGADVSFGSVDSKFVFGSVDPKFAKCDIALRASHNNIISCLALKDKGDTMNASFYHKKPLKLLPNTAIGVELNHNISSDKAAISVGAQSVLNPLITLRACVNNYGKAIVGLQREWKQNSIVTVSGEVDCRAIMNGIKLGVAIDLHG